MNRALLARETGWTFRHIEEEMDFEEIEETLAIFEAVDKGQNWVQQRNARKQSRTPRRSRR